MTPQARRPQAAIDASAAGGGSHRSSWRGCRHRASHAIALAARYVQTDPLVTPGEANGAIVFTIDYQ